MTGAEGQAEAGGGAPKRRRAGQHALLRIGLPVAVVAISIAVLHRLATEARWVDVRADIAATPAATLGLALVFTLASFVALSLLDVLALAEIEERRVPKGLAALTGASAIAISNLLGFSYLTATSIRLRVYASFDVDTRRVAGVFALGWLSFSASVMLLLGVQFLVHPGGGVHLPFLQARTESAIGLTLLALVGGGFAYLAAGHRRWHVGRFSITLPRLRTAALMTLASAADLLMCALVLYTLLPADLAAGFPQVFLVFVAAVALGVFSHAPGGLGVFEATVVAGLGAGGRPDVLAALVLYRLVYTLFPFLVAALGLALAWGLASREAAGRLVITAYRLSQPLVPFLAAGLAILSGVTLLVSGALPSDPDRLRLLQGIQPLPLLEASNLTGSVAGVLLLVVARGLYRRLARAWAVAVGLLCVGLAASLLRGLDVETALALLLAVSLLAAFRPAFYRRAGAGALRLSGPWILSLATLLATLVWIGVFAHAHVAYRDALWWEFAWHGDASRFLRASLAGAVVLAGISLNSLLSGRPPAAPPEPIPEAVRSILSASPASGARLALTGDKSFLVSADGRAFVSYADTGRTLITMGDPVGPADSARALIWEFRRKADLAGRRCAFFGIAPDYLPTYLDMGLSLLKIGEVARVELAGFSLEGPQRKDFRYATRRAAREGCAFEVIPAAEIEPLLPELRRISDAWLAVKQGEEKGFALGAFDETYLKNFDHVVLRDASGRILAFANLWLGADLNEVAPDLMRYDPDGPAYAMDALFGELMLWAKAQGYHWFNLGAAPFAGMENRPYASLWTRIGSLLYEHGEYFYHFEGLRAFKQKFDPVWTPKYLAGPGGLAAPRILYEINELISGGFRGLIQGD
jgi:phosphatidylglycerol lysyltransferase